MTNGFLKRVSQKAQDSAKQAAKRFAQEPVEILRHARSQTVGIEAHSPIVDQILKAGDGKPELTPQEKEEMKIRARKRLQELKEDLKRENKARARRLEEWRRQQGEFMKQTEKQEVPQQLLEPATKRKRGFLGFVKKKQGTKEMGKTVSG